MDCAGTHPGGVQEIVGAGRLNDFSLLLDGEVLPGELRVHIRLVQLHDLVVANRPRVGIVHDARESTLGLYTEQEASSDESRNTVGPICMRIGPVVLSIHSARKSVCAT